MTAKNHTHHEIVETFDRLEMPLSDTLIEMLNEDYTHRTERRGCGYTQATRALATNINLARTDELDDLKLFNRANQGLRSLLLHPQAQSLGLKQWRNLDLRKDLATHLQQNSAAEDSFWCTLAQEVAFQHRLRNSEYEVSLEESRVWIRLLSDIILPRDANAEGLFALNALTEKPKVGSCTMAEKFFLEMLYGTIPRKGFVNIIVDDQQRPLMIEKVNIGDSHSCISVAPVMMNGVRIPAASLFAVEYPEDLTDTLTTCKHLRGRVIPASACIGFRFLRLTTLSISVAHRARAFSSHFEWQTANGLFSHHTTDIRQLLALASKQL
ncbi:hypothetical protein [Agitococcus lubricus]|uniref:Uncharacterized protein n=1 Tax=Agitococcus lubricus TaxID=1077255 RepID=A0A2T5J120_9GAMM|nr:hypothetical protein [Agitococcus lubricus]PTQ89989.1 hypothetical protein C8N29_10427 [Agitococcus lubricus]